MMGHLGRWNQTATMALCPQSIDNYIQNLTSSYTEKSNDASMVSASVIMFMLAGLFFNLNLFSGISDVSATLDPKFRLFLSSALSLLLPVMSYLFSEAKNSTKRCKYIVMGEESLVPEPTADGYELDMAIDGAAVDSGIITVGKVWAELDENNNGLFTSPDQVQRLKRLCLSFALFKLLRRKFEHLPAVTGEEADDCRDLIFKGLLHNNNNGGNGIAAEELFQVINDEIIFFSEYYHSVVPVVLASPFFLLVNYFLVLAVVAVLCAMTVILCGNGDAIYAFKSVVADNYTFHSGIGRIAICLIIKAKNSPEAFFSIVDLSITILLFVIYFYEEIWEFFVFVLSNWFMVSLVCTYMARPQWRDSPYIRYAVHWIIWLRSKLNHGSLSFRQLSVLSLRWPLGAQLCSPVSLVLKKELVPRNLKQSIVDGLMEQDRLAGTVYHTPLTNGKYALQRNCDLFGDKLSWACRSDSVSEVFLTWHIGTSILEVLECNERQEEEEEAASWRRAATRLSKYCAYLVMFHPELLPDNPEKAERVVDGMTAELGGIFWWWEYYLCSQRARVSKIVNSLGPSDGDHREDDGGGGVVRNGARLGKQLADVAGSHGRGAAWKAVAEVWTELVVFAAPSAEEERVKGHGDVLVQGGEFITVLWALATHAGVSRESGGGGGKPAAKTLEDLMAESMRGEPPPPPPPAVANLEIM